MYAKYLNKMWTYIIFSRYLRFFDVFIWPWLINGEVILDFPYLLFWSAETMKDSYNHNCSFLRKQPRCRRGPGRLETTEKEFEGLSHVYPKKKSWNLTFLACLSCPVYLVNFLIPSELSLSSYDEVTTHLSELFWRIERKLETSTGRLQKSANGSSPLSMTSRQGTPLSSGSHSEEMTGISGLLWRACFHCISFSQQTICNIVNIPAHGWALHDKES